MYTSTFLNHFSKDISPGVLKVHSTLRVPHQGGNCFQNHRFYGSGSTLGTCPRQRCLRQKGHPIDSQKKSWLPWQLQQCVQESYDYQLSCQGSGLSWSYLAAHLPCTVKESWYFTSKDVCKLSHTSKEGVEDTSRSKRINEWDTVLQQCWQSHCASGIPEMKIGSNSRLLSSRQFTFDLPTSRNSAKISWKGGSNPIEDTYSAPPSAPRGGTPSLEELSNKSPFYFRRDYIVEQEGFEDWSWLRPALQVSSSSIGGNRGLPYDFQIREETVRTTFHTSTFVEHGTSEELSNEYTHSLQSRQRIKWWYGQTENLQGTESFLTGHTSKLDVDSFAICAPRGGAGGTYGTPSMNAMVGRKGTTISASRLLWYYGWFQSQAQAKQSIQHGHIGYLSLKTPSIESNGKMPLKGVPAVSTYGITDNLPWLRIKAKPSLIPEEGDIFFSMKGSAEGTYGRKDREQSSLRHLFGNARLNSWASLYSPLSISSISMQKSKENVNGEWGTIGTSGGSTLNNPLFCLGASYSFPSWLHLQQNVSFQQTISEDAARNGVPEVSMVSPAKGTYGVRSGINSLIVRCPTIESSLSENLVESFFKLHVPSAKDTPTVGAYGKGEDMKFNQLSKVFFEEHSRWRHMPSSNIFWSSAFVNRTFVDQFFEGHYQYPYCLYFSIAKL